MYSIVDYTCLYYTIIYNISRYRLSMFGREPRADGQSTEAGTKQINKQLEHIWHTILIDIDANKYNTHTHTTYIIKHTTTIRQ